MESRRRRLLKVECEFGLVSLLLVERVPFKILERVEPSIKAHNRRLQTVPIDGRYGKSSSSHHRTWALTLEEINSKKLHIQG